MCRSENPVLTSSRCLRIFAGDVLLLLLAFLVVEVALRVVAPQPVQRLLRGMYEITDSGKYQYQPGVKIICNNGFGDHEFSINSWRARDKEYGPKQPGEWRILSVGDSFSDNVALDVEQIYANVLEDDLANRYPDRSFSVVNGGQAGWGVWAYCQYLEKMLPVIQPDVVVIAIGTVGDFVRNAESPPKFAPKKLWMGMPVRREASVMDRISWGIWFVNQVMECHSHAYVAFRRITHYPFCWLQLGKDPRFSSLLTDPKAADEVKQPTTKLVRRIRDLCAAHGASLVILTVPRRYECNPSVLRLKIQLENPDLGKLDITRPRRLLEEIAADAGVPLYDPTDDLSAGTTTTYLPVFLHWNENGNRIVAGELLRFLEREDLLGL